MARIIKQKKYLAISLEQLLISLFISSIIILILLQIYIIVKKYSIKIEQKIAFLHAIHTANFIFRSNLAIAGYRGPISISSAAAMPVAVCRASINSCKNLVSKNILHKIANRKIKPDSDILIAYNIPQSISYLRELNHNLPIGEQVIIANLQSSQRVTISSMNNNFHFVNKFPANTELIQFKDLVFYVAKNSVYQPTVYSLYVEDLSGTDKQHAQAILDHIENLVVTLKNPNYIWIDLLFNNKSKQQNIAIGVKLKNSYFDN
jgi:hypothetical protein